MLVDMPNRRNNDQILNERRFVTSEKRRSSITCEYASKAMLDEITGCSTQSAKDVKTQYLPNELSWIPVP